MTARCESRLGRRRPFIIFLCTVALVGLSLLTFAPSFSRLFDSNLAGLVVAIVGSQLMDWGLDSTETPAKAYTLDCIHDLDMQASAINIQSVLTGIGGGCGYLLAGLLGMEHRKELYYIAVTVFIISLLLTLSSFKERQYRKKPRPGLQLFKQLLLKQQNKPCVKQKKFNVTRQRLGARASFSDPNHNDLNPSSGSTRKGIRHSAEISRSNGAMTKKSVTFQNRMEEFKNKIEKNEGNRHKTTQSEQFITKYQRPITMARGFAMTTTRWQSGSIYRVNDCNSMPAGLDKG